MSDLVSRLGAALKGSVSHDREMFQLLRSRYAEDPPPYTTSIDAALTLLPAGFRYQLGTCRDGCWAIVTTQRNHQYWCAPFAQF